MRLCQWAIAAFTILFACPVWAQEAPAKPTGPPLPAALDAFPWRAESRGALLAVLNDDTKPEAAPPAQTLNELAARYGRMTRRFGSVTVLAPQKNNARNLRPGKPDLQIELRRGGTVPQLLATLSASQWRQIASRTGLGVGDMTAPQRAVWERIVPNPFVYDETTTQYVRRVSPPEKTHTLSPQERENIRLHIKLIGDVTGKRVTGEGFFPLVFNKNNNGGTKEFLALVNDNEYAGSDTEFGQKLDEQIPNRPKPSDLNFDALTTPVSLALPPGSKMLTFGTLVERIAKASNIELYAFGEMGNQINVWAAPGSPPVAAGALLRGLVFSFGGTVRRVGPDSAGRFVYVLARDLTPEAAQVAVLDDWFLDASRQRNANGLEATRRIRAKNPLPLLGFDADDPVPLTPQIIARIFAQARAPQKQGGIQASNRGLEIRLSELPPAQQKAVIAASAKLEASQKTEEYQKGGIDFRTSPDPLWVTFTSWLGFVLPNGAGEITNTPLGGPNEWQERDKEIPVPFSLAGKILSARAENVDEARAIAREALAQKCVALYLEAAPDALRAAVEEGKAALPIAGIARLLTAPVGKAGNATDLNVFRETSAQYHARIGSGETSRVWLAPDEPEVLGQAVAHVSAAASVPGLAGLVLRDTAPPGYRTRKVGDDTKGDAGANRDGAAGQMGYSLAHRLAFLREKGQDPADIIMDSPTNRNFDDAGRAWAEWRFARAQSFREAVTTAARRTAPNLPLFAAGELTWRGPDYVTREHAEWWAEWPQTKTAEPELFHNARRYLPPESATVRPKKTGAYVVVDLETMESDTAAVNERLRLIGDGWSGTIVDVSGLPWKDAQKRLAALSGQAAVK